MVNRRFLHIALTFLLVFSFAVPFLMLYFRDPGLYERTWIGRTFYLFFIWLVVLEIIIDWEDLRKVKMHRIFSFRTSLTVMTLTLPTVYVVLCNNGLNAIIENLALQGNVAWHGSRLFPISTEYLVFTILFSVIVISIYGVKGLLNFSTAIIFLGVIGMLYTMDNLYPVSTLGPFQFIVFTTASLAAAFLGLGGYQVTWGAQSVGMPVFMISDSLGRTSPYLAIAWSCAGVESLLIYSVVMLLFLKKTPMYWVHKAAYFVVGGIVTYVLNGLRIFTLFVIFLNNGDWQTFHDYYGMLYSVAWITVYPLIIIGTQTLFHRYKKRESLAAKDFSAGRALETRQ